ncbi:hypothetical protein [Clostridium sp. BSD9I1]|uniref:hypothetical protein n=1 Tax=Clostridium sp. BSD9I1 TaxID=2003589 RepID=UPI001FA8B25F|nr:hypothetical protein [Clostridium sp. BSD9I1]
MTLKSSHISKGGLLTALGVLLIYLSTIIPTNKIFILGIASSLTPVALISTSLQNTITVYIATSIISFLLLGLRGQVILYIIFFGTYGIIKFLIERIRNSKLEWLLKYLFFNLCLFLCYLLYKFLFLGEVDLTKIKLPIPLFIIALEIAFYFYDYVLTYAIHYVKTKLLRNL